MKQSVSNPSNADVPLRLADVVGVADMMACSTKTVRRLVDAGKLPGVVRVGRLLRFDLAVLANWVRQGCPPQHRFSPKG